MWLLVVSCIRNAKRSGEGTLISDARSCDLLFAYANLVLGEVVRVC